MRVDVVREAAEPLEPRRVQTQEAELDQIPLRRRSLLYRLIRHFQNMLFFTTTS